MVRGIRRRDRERELVHLLVDTGMRRKLAVVLVCIAEHEEVTSADIEKKTGLRQPEVSITVQELEDRGWVERKSVKKGGKGRPANLYYLSKPFPDIVKNIEDDVGRKINKMKKNIKKLKKLASKFP